MDKQVMPLSHLPINKKAKIVSIQGGYGFQRKLGIMGIREKHSTINGCKSC